MLEKPPIPVGPPLPPPPFPPFISTQIFNDNLVIDLVSDKFKKLNTTKLFTTLYKKNIKLEKQKETLYNKFMRNYIANYLSEASKTNLLNKCKHIDMKSLNYLYLNDLVNSEYEFILNLNNIDNTSKLTSTSTTSTSTSTSTSTTTSTTATTSTTLSTILTSKTTTSEYLVPIFETATPPNTAILEKTSGFTNPIYNLTNPTSFSTNEVTKLNSFDSSLNLTSTNFTNTNDLFTQLYSNSSMFLYNAMIIPLAVVIIILLMVFIGVLIKNIRNKPQKMNSTKSNVSSFSSSFAACYSSNSLQSTSLGSTSGNNSTILTRSPSLKHMKKDDTLNKYNLNDIINHNSISTIAKLYSIRTCPLNSTSDMKRNDLIEVDEIEADASITKIEQIINYDFVSLDRSGYNCSEFNSQNYPNLYNLSTFGRYISNGPTPTNNIKPSTIRTNCSISNKSNLSDTVVANSNDNFYETNHNSYYYSYNYDPIDVSESGEKTSEKLNKSASRVFPRTNPLCRNYGTKSKSADTTCNNQEIKKDTVTDENIDLNCSNHTEFIDVCIKL